MNIYKDILINSQKDIRQNSDYMEIPYSTWRGYQWACFADDVCSHIESYSVPQYGDMPNDQASEFTVDEIAMNMKRYLNRVGSNARGKVEARRDMLKIAHYACMAYAKMMEAEGQLPPTKVEGL